MAERTVLIYFRIIENKFETITMQGYFTPPKLFELLVSQYIPGPIKDETKLNFVFIMMMMRKKLVSC
jgi:hypothetical protein